MFMFTIIRSSSNPEGVWMWMWVWMNGGGGALQWWERMVRNMDGFHFGTSPGRTHYHPMEQHLNLTNTHVLIYNHNSHFFGRQKAKYPLKYPPVLSWNVMILWGSLKYPGLAILWGFFKNKNLPSTSNYLRFFQIPGTSDSLRF
jgi:hypothetical protein